MGGTEVLSSAILFGLLYLLWRVVLKERGAARPTKLDLSHSQLPHQKPAPQPVRPDPSSLYELASTLSEYYQHSAHPDALLSQPRFIEGVELLNSGGYSSDDLITYYHGDNAVLACMALEAYARRADREDVNAKILANINGVVTWTRYFVLRALSAGSPPGDPLVGRVLARIDTSWKRPLDTELLKDFIQTRLNGGEVPDFTTDLNRISEDHVAFIQELLEGLKSESASRLLAEFNAWRSTRNDINFLSAIGRVWSWSEIAETDPPIENESLSAQVAAVQAVLLKDRPRSVLLVGETGVGKSTIVRVVGKRLKEKGWVIFEAGHTELIAGKPYVGDLEERFRRLLHLLGGRKILWYFPDFHTILWAGRHQYSSTSALDYFLPHIEQGEITVLGETQPLAYEKLVQSKPRCRTAMEVCRIPPLPQNATLQLAREWTRHHGSAGTVELASEGTLREAWQLTQQYLGEKSSPGNLLEFLKLTRERLFASGTADQTAITTDELIVTLTQLTGLPASILDDRQNLDLKGLRGFFEKRVLGQPEAVECLVDRVGMIKAGVTDPTRPQGVFLFVGPTGTGKTEIAKALSEYLFGSPLRMIRLDMSELQEPESLERILGRCQPRQWQLAGGSNL